MRMRKWIMSERRGSGRVRGASWQLDQIALWSFMKKMRPCKNSHGKERLWPSRTSFQKGLRPGIAVVSPEGQRTGSCRVPCLFSYIPCSSRAEVRLFLSSLLLVVFKSLKKPKGTSFETQELFLSFIAQLSGND